uniref:Uncharacterized protein n=1 Tax=Graphocephala atropunctata TaxID=36148 RepID=A0A1B6L2I8_9HEMI
MAPPVKKLKLAVTAALPPTAPPRCKFGCKHAHSPNVAKYKPATPVVPKVPLAPRTPVLSTPKKLAVSSKSPKAISPVENRNAVIYKGKIYAERTSETLRPRWKL